MSLNIEEMIKECGFAVIAVFGDGKSPSFAYTIGLTETLNHPELLITGLGQQPSHTLLSQTVERIRDKGPLKNGDMLLELANFPLAVRDCTREAVEDYAVQCLRHYYGGPFKPRFQQLVITDREGRHPWDEHYDYAYMNRFQPELWTTIQ